MGKLNPKRIASLTPKDREYKLHDGSGLFLRVRTSGAKSWLFSFRLPNDIRQLRMTLGSIDSITLKEARNMLPELHKLISQGIDPRRAQAATRVQNTQAITMQELFQRWIGFLKATNEVTLGWIKKHEGRWKLHLKNSLGDILAKDITHAHLAAALDAMSHRGIKEETRKALTTLNLMLDYGRTRHLIDQNPARILKPKDFAASANRPRNRVLSLTELRRLWSVLDVATLKKSGKAKTSTMSPITAAAIKLLILTGARRGEVAAIRWDELNLAESVWLLPAAKTKNKQAHSIYLSNLTIYLLEELKLLTGNSQYVFDSQLSSNNHIHTDALTKAITRLRKINKDDETKNGPLADMSPFTIHDIRRSAATAWGEHLKVAPHIIELMLNHQPLNKLIATYQRATYTKEQKSAWLAWGVIVEHQIANQPQNIILFKKSASGSPS